MREKKLGLVAFLRYGQRREEGEYIRVSSILVLRTEEGGGRTNEGQ